MRCPPGSSCAVSVNVINGNKTSDTRCSNFNGKYKLWLILSWNWINFSTVLFYKCCLHHSSLLLCSIVLLTIQILVASSCTRCHNSTFCPHTHNIRFIILAINSNYSLWQHYQLVFIIATECFLWGRKWSFIYNVDEHLSSKGQISSATQPPVPSPTHIS